MTKDMSEWDLSHMTPEEQALFAQAIKKPDSEKSVSEKAAYNKAAQVNVDHADTIAKSLTEVREIQLQAFTYGGNSDPEQQEELWLQRKIENGGVTDENGTFIPGEWEYRVFYPAYPNLPAMSGPPTAKDINGTPLPG